MIPQAFTTRDMAEAYKWVQTLPPHVREDMKSMEQIVSLYLRAKRGGGAPQVQAPTADEIKAASPHDQIQVVSKNSSQDFQKTLKNLKVELEQFDFAGQNGQTAAVAHAVHHATAPSAHANPNFTGSPPGHPTPTAAPTAPAGHAQGHGQNFNSGPANGHTVGNTPLHSASEPLVDVRSAESSHSFHGNALAAVRMDPRSRQMINEIREGLNLSSDLEVIRMSLVLAHKSLIGLIK